MKWTDELNESFLYEHRSNWSVNYKVNYLKRQSPHPWHPHWPFAPKAKTANNNNKNNNNSYDIIILGIIIIIVKIIIIIIIIIIMIIILRKIIIIIHILIW